MKPNRGRRCQGAGGLIEQQKSRFWGDGPGNEPSKQGGLAGTQRSGQGHKLPRRYPEEIKRLAGIDGVDWMVEDESTCPC
jgi:hypothetical protein